jgi:hypothetical protein
VIEHAVMKHETHPTCSRCGHPGPHRPTAPARADGPFGCEPCSGCDRLRSRLRIPTAFRLAHLLLLRETASLAAGPDEDVVSLQEVAAGLTERLRSNRMLAAGVRPCWGDTVWLVHDLEDWDLVLLHRVLAQPLTARSRREHPVVAGVSLTQRGAAVVRILTG